MPAQSMQGCRLSSPGHFSIEFAGAVTIQSSQQTDWIAKNGNESLFILLEKIFPQVKLQLSHDSNILKKLACAKLACAEVSTKHILVQKHLGPYYRNALALSEMTCHR
jgi:hypothetical protein